MMRIAAHWTAADAHAVDEELVATVDGDRESGAVGYRGQREAAARGRR
jgi:hypothetical protein